MQLNSRFLDGFFKSWGVILASEIGDKTFFIAAVMAMRNSRRLVRATIMQGSAAEGRSEGSCKGTRECRCALMRSDAGHLSAVGSPVMTAPIHQCAAGVCGCDGCSRSHDGALCGAGLGSAQPGACAAAGGRIRVELVLAGCGSPPGSNPTLQISKKYTHYAATLLFFFFGARMLWEAAQARAGVSGGAQEALWRDSQLLSRTAAVR